MKKIMNEEGKTMPSHGTLVERRHEIVRWWSDGVRETP